LVCADLRIEGSAKRLSATVRRSREHVQRGSQKAGKSKADVGAANPGEHPGVPLFMALRGMGAETFRYLGGSEAWLTAERAQFYGPDKEGFI
jgi:hypothetical protein